MADLAPVVLFVNHRDQQCGVNQMGQKYYAALKNSNKYNCYYIDPDNEAGFDYWRDMLQPKVVLYNWYTSGATMPWLTSGKIQAQRGRFKQTCIYHEGAYDHMGFDLIFHQDPSFEGKQNYVNLARPIPEFDWANTSNAPGQWPVIGSFGFGLGGKGFDRLVRVVEGAFERATININIPYAKFGDESGASARAWSSHIQSLVRPGIDLRVSHEFWPEQKLLEWLSQNDVNCFFYDENYGRGISGTLDYALAVRKPIAITKSWQFKHVWSIDDSFLIENTSLPDILARGTQHLEKFHQIWGNDATMRSFEEGFNGILQ